MHNLVIFFSFLIQYSYGSAVVIRAEEGTVKARPGTWTTLSVKITSDPYPSLEHIKWSKDGKAISGNSYTVGASGSQLNIALLRERDFGTYRCTVTVAGTVARSDEINLVMIDKSTATVVVTQNRVEDYKWTAGQTIEVLFDKTAPSDLSISAIDWFRDTYRIAPGGRYEMTKVSTTQYKLKIKDSSAADNGNYHVVFKTTKSGENKFKYGIVAFSIKVVGKPIVTVTPATHRVTEGSDVIFTCSVKSSSNSLSYVWKKNGAVISGQISATLPITNVKHDNAAAYICEVSFTEASTTYTAAGQAFLVINEDSTLTVVTPFMIADASKQGGTSLQISVKAAEPIRQEMITWYKDSIVVVDKKNGITFASSKQSLLIDPISIEHEGYYRVIVQLTTVTLEGTMQLVVKSAKPVIVFDQETYVGRTGEQLKFVVQVSGNPAPNVAEMKWYLNGKLIKQGDPQIRFSDNFLVLFKSGVNEADSGKLTVISETKAGKTEKSADIIIIKQNEIESDMTSHNQIFGKSLTVQMNFHMMPLPVEQNVQWIGNNEILTDTNPRIEFYDEGRRLLIKDTSLNDTGTYRISVNKPDGSQASKDIQVGIKMMSEDLAFSTVPSDTTVRAGTPLKVTCDASGTPSPHVTFSKKDIPIRNSGRFYLTARTLQIYSAKVSDTGTYTCRAANGEKTLSKEFKITVEQRITIYPLLTELSTTGGGKATFTVYVKPPNAKVTWTRDGIHFPESDFGHYDVRSSVNSTVKTETLTISGFQSSDEGSYEATASFGDENIFTRSTSMRLKSGGSSLVKISSATGDQAVFAKNTAIFSCNVAASSASATHIKWTRNGVDVTDLPTNIRLRYELGNSNQELRISNSNTVDTGLIMCTVTKNGNTDQSSATLTVLNPIKITSYPTHRRLLVGDTSAVQLSIKVQSAQPDAQIISWSVDGASLGQSTGLSRSISTPSKAGTNKYTVKASLSNWKGSLTEADSADIYVTTFALEGVAEAQVVKSPTDRTAILGSTVTFECIAYGIPDPMVWWSNGSVDVSSNNFTNSYTSKGVESVLIINNVRPDHGGDYRCKANNGKGAIVTKTAYLEIINPPSASLNSPVYYGVLGKELTISIKVKYQNPITSKMCKWYKNGILIEAKENVLQFQDNGKTLKIINVETTHEGMYSFTITTEAGSASTSTQLKIIQKYEQPTVTIPKYYDNVIALHGSAYQLKCNVVGKPIPKVHWKLNGTVVEAVPGMYTVQADSSMRIASVRFNDTGTWTCVGQSKIEGKDVSSAADITLSVVYWLAKPFVYPYHDHKRITVVSGDTLEVNIDVMYRYQIRAHNIVWKRLDFGKTNWTEAQELNTVDPGYDNIISFRRNRRQLLVSSVSTLYSGQYRAYVSTIAGTGTATIYCNVISRVSPQVKWLKTIGNKFYTINGEHDFVFRVNVTGEPFPQVITWYRIEGQNFQGLTNSTVGDRKYLIGYYGNLYFSNPKRGDAGYYKIQATPVNGKTDQLAESSIELIVKDYYLGFQTIPYIGGIQKEGLSVTLTCLARGVPDPAYISWYKGITKLSSTSPHLTISSITKNDKGDYYCVAKNDYGTLYSPKIKLQVEYLDKTFRPISCYKSFAENGVAGVKSCGSHLEEGNVFTLKCNGPDGWPYPKTTWFYNTVAITDNKIGTDPVTNQYGDLIFPWADPTTHSGTYGCQVSNDKASYSNYNVDYSVNIQPSQDTSIQNQKTLEWLIQPQELIAEEFTPVTIACIASSFPGPTYEWSFNGQTLQDTNLSFGKRVLTFDLIEKSKAGKYSCKATNPDQPSSPITADFQLQVATRPDINSEKVFQIAYLGNETEIDIEPITGDPFPTITWTFNGQGIQLNDRIKLQDKKKLRIDPTQASDEGIYQATASNKAGSAQYAIYLKVEEPLEFIKVPPQKSYVAQYSTVVFPCKARGTPKPEIFQWTRKDREHEPFNGLPARAYMDQENSLIIPFAQTWDNGTYICNVTNQYFDSISGFGELIVIEPANIVVPPKDTNIANFGDTVTLSCKCEPQAVATDACEARFYKNGKVFSGAGVTFKKTLDYGYEMVISNMVAVHLGEYECRGTNRVGTSSAFAYITKSNAPYLIKSPAKSYTHSSKSSVQMPCSAIGSKPINYLWRRDGKPIYDTRISVKNTGTLLIEGSKGIDSGRYTCYASNPYGQAQVSTQLTINDAPDKPLEPWVTEIKKISLTQFQATVNIKVTNTAIKVNKYVLTATETDTSVTKKVTLDWSSDNPYTWRNLNQKPYKFTVILQNSIEASVPSDDSGTVDLTAFEIIPNECVKNIKISADKKILSWDPLVGIQKYQIYYKEVLGKSDGKHNHLGETTSSSFDITSTTSVMKPNAEYDFQVVPVVSNKQGLFSEPVRVRLSPTSPPAPKVTGFIKDAKHLKPDQHIVTFDSNWVPTAGVLNKIYVYFKRISYDYTINTKSGSSARGKRSSISPVEVSFVAKNVLLKGLVPGEKYSFWVKTKNENGLESIKSPVINDTTQQGIPGVCNIYYLEGSGRDAILVKWQAPSITNGQIQGYYVYYRLDNSFNAISARIRHTGDLSDPSQLYQNVTGLDEKSTYEFAVSAFTTAGEGALTQWENMTPRSKSIPNKMDSPSVANITWNTIDVYWNLRDDGLTGIDTFTIYLDNGIDQGGQSSYVIPNRNDRYAQISSLDADTPYALSIVATNWIGSSPRSNLVEFRTPKKPLYLRIWFAGMMTGVVTFLMLIFFFVLFYVFVLRKREGGVFSKQDKKFNMMPGRDNARGPGKGSLVLQNPISDPYRSSESGKYSTRHQDPFPEKVRQDSRDQYSMAEFHRPNRQHDNVSYNSYNKPRYDDYDDDRYPEKRGYDQDRYPEKRGYNDDRFSEKRGYDDDRYSEKRGYDDDRYSEKRNYPPSSASYDNDRGAYNAPHIYGAPPPRDDHYPHRDHYPRQNTFDSRGRQEPRGTEHSPYDDDSDNNNQYYNDKPKDRDDYFEDESGVIIDNPASRFSQI